MLEQVPHSEVNISEIFSEIRKENEKVASLDPLDLNDFFAVTFTNLILNGDIEGLKSVIENVQNSALSNNLEIKAFLRDVGVIMAALRRLDLNYKPSHELEVKLLGYAEIIGEPPRDSVFSYGPRNPKGAAQRMFIGSYEEKLFIASFSEGMNGLDNCLEKLFLCYKTTSYDEMKKLIDDAVVSFDSMVDAIVMVRRKIKPEYFTNEMRPFFDPIEVGGKSYSAPGGAQMPILIIDALMWSKNLKESYLEYVAENLRYLPKNYVSMLNYAKSLESIDKYIILKRNLPGNNDEKLKKVFVVLKKLTDRMISFRGAHFKVATDNFKLRQEGAVGSGGYNPNILEIILNETKNYKDLVLKYENGI